MKAYSNYIILTDEETCLIDEIIINKLQEQYGKIGFDYYEKKLSLKQVNKQDKVKINEDLEFYLNNSTSIYSENFCSRIDNFEKEDNQEAYEVTTDFLSMKSPIKGIGAYLWSRDSGIGKTHLATSVAKEIFKKNQEYLFYSTAFSLGNKADEIRDLIIKSYYNVKRVAWIIDDFKPQLEDASLNNFLSILETVYNRGGKVFVTSPNPFIECIKLEELNEESRYLDIFESYFYEVEMTGVSFRERYNWRNQVHKEVQTNELQKLNTKELKEKLEEALKNQNFEVAAKIRDLQKKQSNSSHSTKTERKK